MNIQHLHGRYRALPTRPLKTEGGRVFGPPGPPPTVGFRVLGRFGVALLARARSCARPTRSKPVPRRGWTWTVLYRANAFLRRSPGTLGTLEAAGEVVTRTPGRVPKHVHGALGTLPYGADENAPEMVPICFSSPWKTPSLRRFSVSPFLARKCARRFSSRKIPLSAFPTA